MAKTLPSIITRLWWKVRSTITLGCVFIAHETAYRGFAPRGTQSYAYDFALLLDSFFYSAVWRKTTKHVIILDSLNYRISNFTQVCVLLFLSLGCSLVLWYNLNKKFLDILLYFTCKAIVSGKQHGDRKCDDLQNWLHMTSHAWKPPTVI